jgi:hypothetical protein
MKCVKEMMLADTEPAFDKKLDEFRILEAGNSENLKYFESNWLNCIEKWAKFKRSGLPLNLQETNNPVEVINNDGCDDIINQFYKCVSPIMANWLCNQYNSISNVCEM